MGSVEHGLWFARSADFLQQPWVQMLRWMRFVGDTIFLAGVAALAYFMLGLWTGWSYEEGALPSGEPVPQLAGE